MIETIAHPAHEQPSAPAGRKMDIVIRAAWQLFLDQGFSATSMDAVAKAAGVSKATLYAYFPSKEALFASLIVTECESLQRDLPMPKLSGGLREALREFARQYFRTFINRKDVAFVRIIANESGRFPALARLFYESGPQATIRRLAQFLENAKVDHLLEFDDSMEAAKQFLSLVRGELPLRIVLGLNDFTEETIEREIEAGVTFFLKACQPASLTRSA
ncbi:transcriptional regulator [Bradyrhizobium sp. LTSPM299]|uniref:TetR/AcrR family transcriptional regulator n=1 Tax=Bradyrhizobium sp. LTSPM299 TaxID=1619233 RepID=UPI0005CA90D2|nr:TetR/AcrR family transcriptional regulator [Bradyrhizobium sp. LTSPM299]KJC56248.1 transcriptional regulator [Bradyrhizobium sp. LTSPM299]